MEIFDLKLNDRIQIGDDVVIEILKRTGIQVKIGIEAPRDVKVYRKELYDHLQATGEKRA
ncbi:carbon storage regulator [Ectothiorhodospira haloalkaliphila]|uniref:carbon storage regulator n=1 Tax=Ectothiorhodospira haloalkaliphila TaxID=421628 RepID=UPI000558E9D8|nr:carbon storage regulator [Ectothiorhodospira haloalkaliphila]